MERPLMLMDWHDLYSKNDHLAKSDLQIQCNLHQNFNSILHRVRKSNLKIIWNNKKSRIAKTIFNNKKTSKGIIIFDLRLYYRSIVIKTA